MKRVYNIFVVMMVVLWAPLTIHCKLEKIPGLEFLHCVSDSETQSDCEDDGCQVVESGFYKIEDHHGFVGALDFPIAEFNEGSVLPAFQTPTTPLYLTTGPLGLSCTWQFSFRTALPPRAPSFVS